MRILLIQWKLINQFFNLKLQGLAKRNLEDKILTINQHQKKLKGILLLIK